MLSLAFVAFMAGILTILTPCVLPVLPVILAGSVTEKGKWYPYIVTASLAVSIVIFTIILKASTLLINVPPEFWRYLSGSIVIFLGLTYLFPHKWSLISARIGLTKSNVTLDKTQDVKSSYRRAVLTGAVLGPVFSSCSPTYALLLATVFPVSLMQGISYTILYALGLSWMVLIVARGGRTIISKFQGLADERGLFRKILGLIFVLVGILIVTGIDKKIQVALISQFDTTRTEVSILDRFVPPIKQDDMSRSRNTSSLRSSSGNIQEYKTPPVPLSLSSPFPAPEILGITEWINSSPLTMESLKGKVVLIDFWTYSCINCQRTLPYLTAWDKKYRDQGLVIIGVHAPEFAFEQIKANVVKAVKEAGIEYAVALDNDFALWSVYNNRFWPAKYFIDRQGNVRHYHFGEGDYVESEKIIQYLLDEGKESTTSSGLVSENIKVEGKQTYGQTSETYLGTERRSNYDSLKNGDILSFAKNLVSDRWSLSGKWVDSADHITSQENAKLRLNYSAKNVYLVMAGSGSVKVTVDGKSISALSIAGKDVGSGSTITLSGDKMYHLVEEKSFERGRLLELEFSPGIEAFAFTFGG